MKDQKIELPDVPFIFQYGQYNEDDLRQPDCRLIPYGDFQEIVRDYARRAIEADRKRKGEPVAKVRDRGFEVVDGKHVPTVLVEFPVDDWESRDRFAAAVDTLQPAEPVKCPICYEDEPHTGTCGSSDPKALCNRAEPVKKPILPDLKNFPSGRADPVKASSDVHDLAHEIWAAAQLVPGEGIEDGAGRIAALLARYGQRAQPMDTASGHKAQPAARSEPTRRKFCNELGNHITITIEGPTSTSENTLTPREIAELREALDEHASLISEQPSVPPPKEPL